MRYLIPVLVTMLLSTSMTPAAEIKQQTREATATDTVRSQSSAPVREGNQQILNQEDEQEREEMEESDQINEFGEVPHMDNGNGSTTNQRISWPEP